MTIARWTEPHFKAPRGTDALEREEKHCTQCGAILVGKPSDVKRRRFCSQRCRGLGLRRPPRPCVVCGKLSGVRDRKQQTCSAACGYVLRKTKTRPAKPCASCGQMYFPQRTIRLKYCSRACYRRAVGRRPAMKTLACAQCGKEFQRTSAAVTRTRRSFCSSACSARSKYRGVRDPNRGRRWKKLAAFIRDRDGHCCRRCGKAQSDNGSIPLHVDHVRPWRSYEDKEAANHPDNLAALCTSCHAIKTNHVEPRWFRGDAMAMVQWVNSITLPSACSARS